MTTMFKPEHIRPLHDRIIVKHMPELQASGSRLIVIRENPELIDFIGQGDNGAHNDNRRVSLISQVVQVGNGVRGISKGDLIMHTAWNDFPPFYEIPKDYAMITEDDVMGHVEIHTADA